MKGGIIIAGGQVDQAVSKSLLEREETDIAIGVDRGIAVFLGNDIEADYYLGDLDSLDPQLISKIPPSKLMQFQPEKNASDLELALDLCLDLGLDYVEVFGGTGSRWDHSFSNLLALDRYRQAGLKVILKNQNNQAWALSGSSKISADLIRAYAYLSILPLSQQGITVSVKGVKYPLSHEKLAFGKTRGVSNEGLGDDITIELEAGRAIFILSSD